jgi:hypothetical protein
VVRKDILDALKSDKIKVYVVWTPVLREDERAKVAAATKLIEGDQVKHFWDEDKSLGLSFGKTVTLPRGRKLAWDVYLAFGTNAEWKEGPPIPQVWMHQLGTDERLLDGKKLQVSMRTLLHEPE